MKRVLVIDNYDSFVHNLARLVRLAGVETQVVRNDAIDVAEIEALAPEAIVLSPGPGKPADAGCCIEVVSKLSGKLPMLGVCLGHQAIVEAFGGEVGLAPEPMHGRTSVVHHEAAGLFRGTPNPLIGCRYHSLAATKARLPDCLEVSAWTDGDLIMAVQHRDLPVFGVQFHPEAILTEAGQTLIDNFVRTIA